jgi:hypothetical protein
VRLHVKLRLADLQPDGTLITEGKICERAGSVAGRLSLI